MEQDQWVVIQELGGVQDLVQKIRVPTFLVTVLEWDTAVVTASEAAWAWVVEQDGAVPLYIRLLKRSAPFWRTRWRYFKTSSTF